MDVLLWILNAAYVIMTQRYSMMKEIFVYIVGMKLKKQYKKNVNNIKKISYWNQRILEGSFDDRYQVVCKKEGKDEEEINDINMLMIMQIKNIESIHESTKREVIYGGLYMSMNRSKSYALSPYKVRTFLSSASVPL